MLATTPKYLQGNLDAETNKKFEQLIILTCNSIRMLQYAIPKSFRDVEITPFVPTGDYDQIEIDDSSTYCGEEVYKWFVGENARRRSKHSIQQTGCYFSMDKLPGGVESLMNNVSNSSPDISQENYRKIASGFQHAAQNARRPTEGVSSINPAFGDILTSNLRTLVV